MKSVIDQLAAENCLKINLPMGIGENYVLPYAVCRGAIFSSVEYVGRSAKTRPRYTIPTLIAEFGSVQVFQTAGEQLTQSSADVYAELIRLALTHDVTDGQRVQVEIQADSFLKSIGRDRGLNNRLWLGEEIARLKRASFRYEMPGLRAWETSFISDFTEDRSFRDVKSSAKYVIELNARMVQVFQKGWALLLGDPRKQLHAAKESLGKALYAFYATHKTPLPVAAEDLKRLMGRGLLVGGDGQVLRKSQQNSKWLHDLEASLASLQTATGWTLCQLDRSSGLVYIVKDGPIPDSIAKAMATSVAMKSRKPRASKVGANAITTSTSVITFGDEHDI